MTSTPLADGRPRAARRAGAATSLGAVVATAFLPKCPLCIAVLLSSSGLGIAAARVVASAARPGLVLLAALSALVVLWAERRRFGFGRRAAPDGACGAPDGCRYRTH